MKRVALLLLATSCATAPAYVRAPVYQDPEPSTESLRGAQLRELGAALEAADDEWGAHLLDVADESCALLRSMDASVPPGECPP